MSDTKVLGTRLLTVGDAVMWLAGARANRVRQSHALRPRAIETRNRKPRNAMVWIS
jgi:hypothetical protein